MTPPVTQTTSIKDPAWYDHVPGVAIPHHVKFLRIGFLEYQSLVEGATTETTTITVPAEACFQHPNLQQVQIYLSTVSMIGDSAFQLCPQLEQVEFRMKPPPLEGKEESEDDCAPTSQLISIGNYVFSGCKSLHSAIGLEHAAESLQEFGPGTFYYCKSLDNVDFLPSLTKLQSLGGLAFFHSGTFTTVDLSRAVLLTELRSLTFAGCSALISIHLPPNLLRIEWQAFYECSALEQIIFPSKLQRIGDQAFSNCLKLKVIVLPSTLQQIGQQCFWDCRKLSHVVLPSPRVPFLKLKPFEYSNCTSLSAFELPNPIPRHQWPLILEQFCKADGIASKNGGIRSPKNRNSIVWNFLCGNMAQLFVAE